MIGYDFTYEPGQATGAPLPGMRAGRWWVKEFRDLDTQEKRRAQMREYAQEITRGEGSLPQYPPALHRMPVIDLELCPPAEKEAIAADCLGHLGECLASRVLIIGGDFWPGIPPDWSAQRILAALEGPASKDRAKIFELARRHRPIVRAAGMVTVLGVIHRPDGSPGPNGQYGTSWYLRDLAARGKFYREAYAGTELCAWTCGAYTGIEGFHELSDDDCGRLADAIWADYDSFALYGEKPQTIRLGKVLAERLTS